MLVVTQIRRSTRTLTPAVFAPDGTQSPVDASFTRIRCPPMMAVMLVSPDTGTGTELLIVLPLPQAHPNCRRFPQARNVPSLLSAYPLS